MAVSSSVRVALHSNSSYVVPTTHKLIPITSQFIIIICIILITCTETSPPQKPYVAIIIV